MISQTLQNSIARLSFYRNSVEVLFSGIVHSSGPPRRMPPIALIARPLTEAEKQEFEDLGHDPEQPPAKSGAFWAARQRALPRTAEKAR
jgi:hypothetical protein